MSALYYAALAAAVAQVVIITPGGTITTGDIDNVPATNEAGATVGTATFTVGGTTTAAAVVTGLIASWNGNAALAAMATATGSTTLILTAVTAGVPFYVTSSVTGVGTLTKAATTANSGPSDWNAAANWSTGAVPVTGDAVTIDYRNTASISYGLIQSAVTLAVFNILGTYIKSIGQVNAPLYIGATICNVNSQPANGIALGAASINLNLGTAASTVTVFQSQGVTITGALPINIKANSSSTTINVQAGNVGLATQLPADTATVGAVNVGPGGAFTASSGTTITSCTNLGGTAYLAGSTATVTANGGNTFTAGTVTITTAYAYAGTLICSNRPSGAAITTLTVAGGTVDTSQNASALTFTNTNFTNGTISAFSPSQITYTNGIALTLGTKRRFSGAAA